MPWSQTRPRRRGRAKGEVPVLAVAEQAPGKVEEGVRAQDLGAHPSERRQEERRGPQRLEPARYQERKEGREEGDRRAEQAHDRDAHGQGEAAILDDDQGRPVEEPQGGDSTRQIAEAEGPPPGGSGKGDQEGGQGHPGDRTVAELREGEGEEDAGEDGQALPPRERSQESALATSPVPAGNPCRPATSSALKEERTKTPEYTVGKPRSRALSSNRRKPSGAR